MSGPETMFERHAQLGRWAMGMAMAGRGAEAAEVYHFETASDLMLEYSIKAERAVADPTARTFYEQLADQWWNRLRGQPEPH